MSSSIFCLCFFSKCDPFLFFEQKRETTRRAQQVSPMREYDQKQNMDIREGSPGASLSDFRSNGSVNSTLPSVFDNSAQIRLLMCFAHSMVVNEIFEHILLVER